MKNDANEIIWIDYKSDELKELTLKELKEARQGTSDTEKGAFYSTLFSINQNFINLEKTPVQVTRGLWNHFCMDGSNIPESNQPGIEYRKNCNKICNRLHIIEDAGQIQLKEIALKTVKESENLYLLSFVQTRQIPTGDVTLTGPKGPKISVIIDNCPPVLRKLIEEYSKNC